MRAQLVLVLLAAELFPAKLCAQQVVHVELEIMKEIGTVPEPAKRDAFKTEISEELRKSVAKLLPYWEFRSLPNPQLPKLTITINSLGSQAKPESWGADVELWITKTNGDEITVLPKQSLIEKGQLQNFVDGGQEVLLQAMKTSFASLLRTAKERCLKEAIKVPLVDGSITPRSADRVEAVLPLKWERFQNCATSEFRIEFHIKNIGDAVVYSVGMGLSGQEASPALEGLVVRHHSWKHPGNLMKDAIAKRIAELAKLERGVILFENVPVETNHTHSIPDAASLANP